MQALAKAKNIGWIDFNNFNLEEYEYFEQVNFSSRFFAHNQFNLRTLGGNLSIPTKYCNLSIITLNEKLRILIILVVNRRLLVVDSLQSTNKNL